MARNTAHEHFAAWDELRSEYDASRRSRLRRKRRNVNSTAKNADFHYRNQTEFTFMMEYARDIDRNDPVVSQGVTRCVNNVVQGGILPNPQTGNDELDARLRDHWAEWISQKELVSSTGELTFNGIEKLALRSMIVDGDVFIIPQNTGTLRPVEAHRVRSPLNTTRNVVHGILLEENEAIPLEYWITKEDLNPWSTLQHVRGVNKVPVRDSDGERQAYHIYNPKRFSQRRGVTAFANFTDVASMWADLNIAKLVQAQSTSAFAIFRERMLDFRGGEPEQKGPQIIESTGDGGVRTIEGIAMGMEVTGQPGETLKGFSPNVPNPEYFQHSKSILTQIALNLELPLMVFLLDASETNFSGWRGAFDQAKIGLRALQQTLIDSLHTYVYRWKVMTWLEEDPLLAQMANDENVNIFRHQWSPPRWPYIEPVKDITAEILARRNLHTSPRRWAAAQHQEWRTLVKETLEDNKLAIMGAIEIAKEINKDAKSDLEMVNWREVLSLPTPDRITIQGNTSSEIEVQPEGQTAGTPGGNGRPPAPAPRGNNGNGR